MVDEPKSNNGRNSRISEISSKRGRISKLQNENKRRKKNDRRINRIHSSINITGTRFTRQSSNNPNMQNVGTGEGIDEVSIKIYKSSTGDTEESRRFDYNLRQVLGPANGIVTGKHFAYLGYYLIVW